MVRSWVPSLALFGVIALALAAGASAQDKQLYRYVDPDGRVVYTDKQPPPGAKNIQPKRITANVIETNELPLAAQMASEKYPVTLYTADCGDLCRSAETLLNRRGIPYTTVNAADPQGMAKLQALTGANNVPVLQVGEKLIAKGFLETRWQAMLDEAGYPKTPSPRRTPPGGTAQAPAAPPPAAAAPPPPGAPSAAPPAAAPPAAAPAAAPPRDGGYPKQETTPLPQSQ